MSLFGNEEKYSKVRHELDLLGYKHSLGLESLPLVGALLSDFLSNKPKDSSAQENLKQKVMLC